MNLSFYILFFVLSALSQAYWRPEREKVWVSSGGEYAVYRYPETTLWACHRRPIGSSSFGYLYSYIRGMNSLGIKIPMTAPVTNGITSDSVTTCFYLPTAVLRLCPSTLSRSCPRPIRSRYKYRQVVLKKQPPFTVLAMAWQARSDDISMREVNFFQKVIAAEDEHSNKYHREYYLTAGYTSPMSWKQRSELWFVLKSTEVEKEEEEESKDTTAEAENVDVVIVEGSGATIID